MSEKTGEARREKGEACDVGVARALIACRSPPDIGNPDYDRTSSNRRLWCTRTGEAAARFTPSRSSRDTRWDRQVLLTAMTMTKDDDSQLNYCRA